jgi:hypothetical protein
VGGEVRREGGERVAVLHVGRHHRICQEFRVWAGG